MNYQPDCLCGGECHIPCIFVKQIREEQQIEQVAYDIGEKLRAEVDAEQQEELFELMEGM
jgi:hypothetical protein